MKKINLLLSIIIFSLLLGCTNTAKREITPTLVYEAILADDSHNLVTYLNEGFPANYGEGGDSSLLATALKYDSVNILKVLAERDVNFNNELALFKVRSFQALQFLVENGADINIRNRIGEPLLIYYIKRKPEIYTKYILENGADINTEDMSGWPPIFWAASVGELNVLQDIVKFGGNVHSTDAQGNNPIYYTTDGEKLNFLLGFKYDLHMQNRDRENILGEVLKKAVANREFTAVRTLINKGVNPNYKSYGKTPLNIAETANDSEMVRALKALGAH